MKKPLAPVYIQQRADQDVLLDVYKCLGVIEEKLDSQKEDIERISKRLEPIEKHVELAQKIVSFFATKKGIALLVLIGSKILGVPYESALKWIMSIVH
jgi:tetrahydromethanopterin S-methyltransferase subunit G